jgi:prepilin-type N-terminal cleavage/methylation domain-containing protein
MCARGLVKKVVFPCRACRGFTLIEVLVALAVGSMIMVGASQVIQLIIELVPRAEASMLAMRQAQFAGDFIVRDTLTAQVITPADTLIYLSATPLVLTHIEYGSGNKTIITYSVDAGQKLRRVVSENSTVISDTQVADSITSLSALYTEPPGKDRKMLSVTIIATVGGASENRTYQTAPRSY